MSRGAAGIPLRVGVANAVNRQQKFSGSLPVSKLSRLRDALATEQGQLSVSLQFERAQRVAGRVQGQISAQLEMQCQRCLQPCAWVAELAFDWVLVESDAQAERLLQDCEPVLIEEDMLQLQEALQDEVMLALPLVAYCSGGCPGDSADE